MQNQETHGEKFAHATTSSNPQSNPEVPPIPPPAYTASAFPLPQPSGSAHPTAPVLHEPTSARHNTDTTVLIQAQAQAAVVEPPREWSTGLFDCCQDMEICLLGYVSVIAGIPFLHFLVGETAEGNPCAGLACCAVAVRTKIRMKHNIQGSVCKDCLAVHCCISCALCQMQREMRMHGI